MIRSRYIAFNTGETTLISISIHGIPETLFLLSDIKVGLYL
jgi:hypothetical protein